MTLARFPVARRVVDNRHLRAALPGWLAARVLVIGALAVSRLAVQRHWTGGHVARVRTHQGLLAWDADWYRRIALHGYAALPRRTLRFFPLFPLLGRIGRPLGGSAGVSVVLLLAANTCALGLGALVHQLVVAETGDHALARRSAWLVALAPPAFVLVMGYAEPLAIALTVVAFLALRRRRWWWAAAAALAYGAIRPVGVLLCVPAAIEAGSGFRLAAGRERMARLAAVAAAPLGGGAFLVWVGERFGDPLLPYRVQEIPGLRGHLADPVAVAARAVGGLATGQAGRQLHYPWLILLVVGVVALGRHWPASYTAFAGVTLTLAAASYNLNSLERYAFGCFPLVLAGAGAMRSPAVGRAVVALSSLLLGAYATAAFLAAYVP